MKRIGGKAYGTSVNDRVTIGPGSAPRPRTEEYGRPAVCPATRDWAVLGLNNDAHTGLQILGNMGERHYKSGSVVLEVQCYRVPMLFIYAESMALHVERETNHCHGTDQVR